MDKRTAGLGVVGLIALASGPLAKAKSPTGGSQSATSISRQKAPDDGQASATDLFIKPDLGRARSGVQLLGEYFQNARYATSAAKPTIDVVIATLPDPLDSHLDYEFDAELAALRQAFETSGFVTDRFWLPWPIDREKADLASRNGRIDTTTYHQSFPGVVLFRNTKEQSLRLLYVVGEVPTSGIRPAAFERALTDRQNVLMDPRVTSTSRAIRVVGPAFTGGAQSLAYALSRRRPPPGSNTVDSAVVISGSATGDAARAFVRLGNRVSYHATVHSELVLERVERNVLCELLQIPMGQIARLRESSTDYGASPLDTVRDTTSDAFSRTKPCAGRFLDIPFPANISSLRTEYARTPNAAAVEPSLGTSVTPKIALNLQDPARAMENPPVMSGLTPAVLDVWLDQLATAIVAQRIRAVGILATDARDKLFLAEQLRSRLRELTLFTTESNALLLRKEVNPSLRGMLVFATYPLQLEVQQWDTAGVGDRRLSFASDGSEGIFNAARLQLNAAPWLAEYGVPGMKGERLYCERGQAKVESRDPADIPPVWVLAIGRSGYFPIAACPTGNSNSLMISRPAASPRAATVSVPTTVVCLSIGLVLLMTMAAVIMLEWQQCVFICGEARTMRKHTCIRKLDWLLLVLQTHLYAALRIIALTGLGIGIGVGVLHRLGDETVASTALQVATGAALFIASILVASRLVFAMRVGRKVAKAAMRREHWAHGNRREHVFRWLDFSGRFLMFGIAITYIVTGLRFVLEIKRLSDDAPMKAELFLHRAGELAGGYSPGMVLTLTGAMFALWSSWHLSRIKMLLTSTSAFENASQPGWRGAAGGAARSPAANGVRWDGHMRETRLHLILFTSDVASIVLFVVSLLLGLQLMRAITPSYETLIFTLYDLPFRAVTLFDLLARFGLVASIAASGWAVFRTARVWRGLQRVLDDIGRTPHVTAFERLPRRIARLTQINILRPHAAQMVRSVSMTQVAHMRQLYADMTLTERQSLTATRHALPTETDRAARELEALMTIHSSGIRAWTPDDFMSHKAPPTMHAAESRAVRFLLGLTMRAQLNEPGESDLKQIVARTEKVSESGSGPRSTSGHIRRTFGDRTRIWLRATEELIAVQAVDYIQSVVHHLRCLTLYIVISLVLTTELVWSYELHPASTLWLMIILLVVAAVSTLTTVVIQMNRNEVLSRIAGSAPGTVTWDLGFILNLSLLALVPILAFVGSELPWLHDGLLSWVAPLLRSLGGH